MPTIPPGWPSYSLSDMNIHGCLANICICWKNWKGIYPTIHWLNFVSLLFGLVSVFPISLISNKLLTQSLASSTAPFNKTSELTNSCCLILHLRIRDIMCCFAITTTHHYRSIPAKDSSADFCSMADCRTACEKRSEVLENCKKYHQNVCFVFFNDVSKSINFGWSMTKNFKNIMPDITLQRRYNFAKSVSIGKALTTAVNVTDNLFSVIRRVLREFVPLRNCRYSPSVT